MELNAEQVDALASLVKLSAERLSDMVPRVQQDGLEPMTQVGSGAWIAALLLLLVVSSFFSPFFFKRRPL